MATYYMKRVFLFLFFVLILTSVVSAEIIIHDENKTIENITSANEIIEGKVNITIINEPYDLFISSNDDDHMSLDDFFDNVEEIENVNKDIAKMLVDLYHNDKLTDINVKNELQKLREQNDNKD